MTTMAAQSAAAGTFHLPVRIYYEDTDAGGVVYYANYLKYFERARTEWLRAAGFDQGELARERNLLFVVRSIEVQYQRPARLDDRITVTARTESIRRASVDFVQSALGPDEATLATGRVRIACLDARSFAPTAMPDDLLEVFL